MPSKKILKQKQAEVVNLTEQLKQAKAAVLVDYRGLTVAQDTALRSEMRNANVQYSVVKNSLLRFAVKECGLDGLSEHLKGPTAIALSVEDLVAPAKVVSDNAKKYDVMEVKVGILDGVIIDTNQVKALAELPSKEQLVATVLGTMNAPIRGLATVLNGTMQGLAVALNAIAEQKSA